MLSGRRYESHNPVRCFDMLVQVYLSYLLLVLSNFVVDESNFQPASNQFIAALMLLVSVFCIVVLVGWYRIVSMACKR
jgi:hypothetical protein